MSAIAKGIIWLFVGYITAPILSTAMAAFVYVYWTERLLGWNICPSTPFWGVFLVVHLFLAVKYWQLNAE